MAAVKGHVFFHVLRISIVVALAAMGCGGAVTGPQMQNDGARGASNDGTTPDDAAGPVGGEEGSAAETTMDEASPSEAGAVDERSDPSDGGGCLTPSDASLPLSDASGCQMYSLPLLGNPAACGLSPTQGPCVLGHTVLCASLCHTTASCNLTPSSSGYQVRCLVGLCC
jgi:hypothetical protein